MEQVIERLDEVVVALESVVVRLVETAGGERIVATVASEREEELERNLADAETRVAALQAAASGRKTAGAGRMTAKEAGEVDLAAALDGALQSLSVEQRIAVKAELMRAGVV